MITKKGAASVARVARTGAQIAMMNRRRAKSALASERLEERTGLTTSLSIISIVDQRVHMVAADVRGSL